MQYITYGFASAKRMFMNLRRIGGQILAESSSPKAYSSEKGFSTPNVVKYKPGGVVIL